MSTETELEKIVVRLIGDASSYNKMLSDADKSTQKTMTSIERMGKNIEAVQKQLERVGAGITRFGQGLRGIGTAASLAITAPITALAGVATNEFNQFESALSRMKGLVGLSNEEIKGFKEEILKLAVVTGKAPLELAQAMENITSSGVQGNAALETLTVTARAAAGGLGEVRSVSDTVTSAMNAYGVANLSATKATDILVAAVREGKAEAETFAPVLGNVLPIANEMGISFDEAAGSIAYLTLATGSASTAATQYQNILAQTIKLNAKHDSGKILVGAGIDIEGFKKDVASGGLQPALMKMKDSLAKVGLTLKDAFPDVQAMTAALQLTGANAGKAASVINNVSKAAGSVDKAFEAAAETTKFKLAQSMAEMKVILIELGEIIAPVFAKMTSWLGNAMQMWKGLNANSKQWVVTVLATAAAIGPLLVGLGTFIALGGSVITGLGTIIGLFGSLLAAIGPVTISIAALGVYLVTQTDIMGQALQWFGQQWKKLLDYVKPAIDGIKGALGKGDLELAVKILWAQIQLSWVEGTQSLKEVWITFNESFVKIGTDAVAAYLFAMDTIARNTDIAAVRLNYIGTSTPEDTARMNAEIDAINNRHNLRMTQIADEHKAAIDNGKEEADNARQLIKDNIEDLKSERDKLVETAVADPLLGNAKTSGSGLTPDSNPALKEANTELDKLKKKGDVKISLKFDAAKSGSAEAMARIAEYKALAGQVVKGGVKKSVTDAAKAVPKKDILPEGLGDFKDPMKALHASDEYKKASPKYKRELNQDQQSLVALKEAQRVQREAKEAEDMKNSLTQGIGTEFDRPDPFGIRQAKPDFSMPSQEELRQSEKDYAAWSKMIDDQADAMVKSWSTQKPSMGDLQASRMVLESQLKAAEGTERDEIKETLERVILAIEKGNKNSPELTLAAAGFNR